MTEEQTEKRSTTVDIVLPTIELPAEEDESAGEEEKADSGRSRRRRIIAAVVALLVLLLIAGGAWLLLGSTGSDFFDANAQSGQAPYKTQEEMQAELDRIVEEGMFNISIANVIQFADGASPGTAYIENVPGNRYLMQVAITLDDSGETVYESKAIKPDSYIGDITLTKDLDAGNYPATATFKALDQESHEEVGQAAAKVTLAVAG